MSRPSLPTTISLALAAVLLAIMVITFDVNLATAWHQIRSADPLLLSAAAAVHYTTFAFRGLRWHLLLQHSGAVPQGSAPISTAFCSQAILLAWFVNSVAWLRIGDAYRAYLCNRHHRASLPAVAGTLLAERALDTGLIAATLLILLPFIAADAGGPTWIILAGTAGTAVLLATLIAFLLATAKPMQARIPHRLTAAAASFLQGTATIRRSPLSTTAAGILAWAAETARLHLTAAALDIHLPIPVTIFLTLANSILTLAPTPGGVGAVEPGVALLAVRLANLPRDPAAALILVDRAITYLSVIATGATLLAARAIIPARTDAPPAPANPTEV